jgi:hypothetical protein
MPGTRRPRRVVNDDVAGFYCKQQRDERSPGRAGAGHHHPRDAKRLVHYSQSIGERGQDNDRGAVLTPFLGRFLAALSIARVSASFNRSMARETTSVIPRGARVLDEALLANGFVERAEQDPVKPAVRGGHQPKSTPDLRLRRPGADFVCAAVGIRTPNLLIRRIAVDLTGAVDSRLKTTRRSLLMQVRGRIGVSSRLKS